MGELLWAQGEHLLSQHVASCLLLLLLHDLLFELLHLSAFCRAQLGELLGSQG